MLRSMGRTVIIDDEYYADQDHDKAPWVVRNSSDNVVAYYSTADINWTDKMDATDKLWLPEVLKRKLTWQLLPGQA